METEMSEVSPELRIAHLNVLANGADIIAYKKNKQFAIAVSLFALASIAGLIAYYENQLRQRDMAYKMGLEAERLKWRAIIQNEGVVIKPGL